MRRCAVLTVSATGRGAERREHDAYYTPDWVTSAILNALELPDGVWMDPAVGDGAIIAAVEASRPGRQRWLAMDVREVARPAHVEEGALLVGDFLRTDCLAPVDVVITNPPYSIALPFAERAIDRHGRWAYVALLLRLAFLESRERAAFLAAHPPDIYPLAPRPSFTANGKTDSTAYAWFVWPPHGGQRSRRYGCNYPPIGIAEAPARRRPRRVRRAA